MQEKQIKANLQQIIDLATKTTLMLQNQSNKDQQKLSPRKDANPETSPNKCSVCGEPLTNPTHTLCYTHWKEKQEEIENAG